jgi:uncharacterized membrane protein YfcA
MRLLLNVAPTTVAGTSLVFVLANVASSAVGYLRQKRVDLAVAVPLAIGAVPGSIIGVLAVKHVNATGFDVAYGTILVVLAILVMRRRAVETREAGERTFAHAYAVAIPAGFVLGLLSSLFGIGGGVVIIPLLLLAARMPPHIVTATSAFVIALTAPVGVIAHTIAGDVDWLAALPLIAGGLVGGAIAPIVSQRISSPRLVTLLAIALIGAAGGLILRHFL